MASTLRIFDVVAAAALDTAVHTAGDTLFTAVAVPALSTQFRNMGRARLDSILLSVGGTVDPAAVIYIFDSTVTLGAANAAFGLTAADAASKLLGVVAMGAVIASVGAGRTVQQRNLGIMLEGTAGNIYVAAATTGTPTFAASSRCDLRLGITYQED